MSQDEARNEKNLLIVHRVEGWSNNDNSPREEAIFQFRGDISWQYSEIWREFGYSFIDWVAEEDSSWVEDDHGQ